MFLHIFYFKKALFTLCIKSFVGESFKLNYKSCNYLICEYKGSKHTLYTVHFRHEFVCTTKIICNFNINVVIIRYVSTKVKNTFYKLHTLDMNWYVRQRSYFISIFP